MEISVNAHFNAECKKIAEQYNFNLYDAVLIDNGKMYRYEHSSANLANNGYSTAKMFTATAIGRLYDEKKLKLDDKIYDILKDEIHTDVSEEWKKVTVEHALAHKMGIDRGFLDTDAERISQYPTNDLLTLSFQRDIVHTPGAHYQYSDGAYYILSRVVSKLSSEKMDCYLGKMLFNDLGFDEFCWNTCSKGYPTGGTGVYCRTYDMAKLGYVYLNHGEYEGKRVLSQEWVSLAKEKELGVVRCENKSYGKTGAHGQMIAFCDETQKVIAFHAFQCENYDFRGAAIREFIEK